MSSDHVYCDLGPGDQNIFGSCHDTHNSIPAKPVIVLSVRGMPKCSWSCRIIDPRYAGSNNDTPGVHSRLHTLYQLLTILPSLAKIWHS